ncbi:microtubule-associated protein futsch isoform X4 [Maniola jurtina]|uniref:microtubule-associated protein futsch isoform X4 n=1 Tax=Maniola jurtina TaxID=191418 RepID=UPI001E68FC3E|nr:microtubule-associated protein futsch isoform X4 [Maniola jurtina]
MSEADVSLIRDEDVLRRMWQQTEDFSRKKEIRAHMYRLREERLRNLYSPEPGVDAKDLKDLSNAGWNVESENRTTDDGRTHVKSVHANIEGKYDVDGGQGQFAAVDYNKKATTEYDDGKTSLKRNENVSNTAAHEQVVRKTKDGMLSSSTTSSSTATSKFEKVSTREAVPYQSADDFDLSSQKSYNTNRTDEVDDITSQKFTKQNTSEYEQNLRIDFNQGEIVSRKVDYPDENTKVIVETRRLPDGTRVTSTRREFRAPSVQTSHSEQHSYQTRTANKSYETSQKRINETSSKIIHESTNDRNDIVDSQKISDDYDFKRNQTYSENKVDDYNQSTEKYRNNRRVDSHTTVEDYDYRKTQDDLVNKTDDYERTTDQYRKQRKHESDVDDITQRDHITHRDIITSTDDTDVRHRDSSDIYSQKNIDERVHNITRENKTDDFERTTEKYRKQRKHETDVDDITRRDHLTRQDITTSKDDTDVRHHDTSEIHSQKNTDERVHKITRENKVVEKITSTDQYQSTYQTDYTQRKISNDLSPAHQAWASTLRSDTPTRPSTRASSPGSKTFKSSTSSLRSSISPDKSYRKPANRGESPEKTYRTPTGRGESPDKTSRTPVGRDVSPDKTSRTPVGRSNSPDKTFRKPSSRGESPEKSYKTPVGRGESPEKSYRTPVGKSESPDKTYKKPASRDESPEKSYRTPVGRAESPDKSISPNKTYRKPSSRGESPEKSYRTPVGKSESPDKTYRKPASRDESPEKSYRTPVGRAESPDKSTSPNKTYRKPSSRGESPEKNYRTPVGRGESPDKSYGTPVGRDESPDKSSRTPAGRGESPEKSYRAPVVRGESPDKTSKKPSSRDGSPSKIDRHSPSRTVSSDKYSTTESTTTVKETTVNKHNSSKEYLQDSRRSRLSTSPEKPDQNHRSRTSPSPERKPKSKANVYDRPRSPTEDVEKITTPQRWNSSPMDGRPTNFLSTSPKNYSPDRLKSDIQRELFRKDDDVVDKFQENAKTKPTEEPQRISSQEEKYPKSLSPTRSSTEPLQKYPKNPARNASQEPEETSHSEPGYMRPTATSKPKLSDDSKLPSATSPTKNVPSKSPERRSSKPTINKISDQHYKFIDEETKMYTRDDNEELVHMIQKQTKNEGSTDYSENVNETTKSHRSPSPDTYHKKIPSSPSKPSPASPVRQGNLNDDIPISQKSPTRKNLPDENPDIFDFSPKSYPQKSPSPSRNKAPNSTSTIRYSPVKDNHPVITDNKDKFTDSYDRKESPTKDAPEKYEPKYSPEKIVSQRSKAPSPSKFESYDLKRNTYEEEKRRSVTITDETIEKSKPEKHLDSPKIGRAPSQTPTNKSPRNSTSPVKSLTKDSKYKHTSDFIGTERTTEEINKTKLKERPRQLITPSTSPTRKPKDLEQAPSSGQSSPTTSVSGFVYYKSPTTDKTIVTDLDEQDFNTGPRKVVTHAPKDDSSKDSPSSKLPCRSPSPEKRPTKESLPRKSSLKKSSITQISPTEKPPTSFIISPNVETKEFTEHKVQIKDHPDKEKDKPIKTKPPFERRETYEERCRKILGMIDTDATETESVTNKNITSSKNLEANVSSPSVSPCRSPSPREEENLLFKKNVKKTTELTKTEECTTQETENKNKTTVSLSNITDTSKKTKTPSRDTSPTKLQDIMSNYEHERNTESLLNKTKTEGYKKPSPTREIKNDPTYEPREPKSLLPKTDISHEINNVKNNLTKSQATDQTPKQKEKKSAITPEYPEKIGTHRRHDSPVRQAHGTYDKPTVVSPKSNRSPSPPKKQLKSELSITKSEIQYATETINEAFVKNVTEVIVDETDHLSTVPISTKPARKIPVGKTIPAKNSEVKVGNKTVSTTNSEYNSEFIVSEKEREELDRIQKLPKQHSPDCFEKSPTHKKTPFKPVTLSTEEVGSDNMVNQTTITKETTIIENDDITHIEKQNREKVKDQKIASKPPSRNVSPTKKVSNVSPAPTRSISPKKPQSPIERPQSPQVTKTSGIKPRDQVPSHIRKPSPSGPSPTKTDKSITTDVKKLNTTVKQSSFTKSSTTKVSTNKTTQNTINKVLEQEPKKTFAPKGTKDYLKKDVEIKVTRTASDTTLKTKKTSPQRMRSKPEIQVNDKVTKQTTTTNKYQKYSPKDSQTKLPTSKPKSATALNTSTDEDDVIIDVQQAKSSRENSPDRICPTPVGFSDDNGTPRFPDEVNEPDDEYHTRTHHTIHETESIVDDIVEICEDDELFVKRTDDIKKRDDSLLSVNDKVSKFNTKIDNVNKTKDTTTRFKETERKVHSDFDKENLKSDQCLLSVSEKVNKFAKGPVDSKDRSPSRNIIDEYDNNTTYQDDYTKLSVNDKAHLFIETAENVKTTKTKPAQKIERPDLSSVDDSLKSDDCLLSVSDKVNKFVKTAEQFLNETLESEEKERKIREQHEKIMRKIVDNQDDNTINKNLNDYIKDTSESEQNNNLREPSFAKETASSNAKVRDVVTPNVKTSDKTSTVKITTLRSSEAVKKAKALFENIASTTSPKTKEVPNAKPSKVPDTSLTKKTPLTSSVNVRQSSFDNDVPKSEVIKHTTSISEKALLKETTSEIREPHVIHNEKPRSSPARLRPQSPDRPRSPSHKIKEISSTTVTTITSAADLPNQGRPSLEKSDKPQEKVPGYQRPTKTSQLKEETKVSEETDISSRRGSGKFGVELRRTSIERATASAERRRSSVEHHQPCIEDIFDLDLLEQMLEKVVGYEQRRRIRAQMRVAKKMDNEQITTNTVTRNKQTITKVTKTSSPERQSQNRSPERHAKPASQKPHSPERPPKHSPLKSATPDYTRKQSPQMPLTSDSHPKENDKPMLNGHAKEPTGTLPDKDIRSRSPNKLAPKVPTKSKSPLRQSSPDKKPRPISPTKTATPKPKSNRFSEYATAYMKKVGLDENDKNITSDVKVKKTPVVEQQKSKKIETHHAVETKISKTTSKNITERTSSKDTIETVHINGKRSPSPHKSIPGTQSPTPQRKVDLDNRKSSPERKMHSPDRKPYISDSNAHRPDHKAPSPERKAHSPDRKAHVPDRKALSPERKVQSPDLRTQSPAGPRHTQHSPDRLTNLELNHQKSDTTKTKKETIIKTVYEIEKKIPPKQKQEEKPSWVTNRNLKKITSETRTFSTKKVEPEKPKYRSTSPSKVISKPLDVITSSYGPGPLDADGRPLFGIKALRNGASNYQVKGTVVRQEFHSRNGGEPEGTVSVTAYSTEPQDLEKLLQSQEQKPSRFLHGLAAITTTKKFGGDTGTTLSAVNNKEERAAIDQFTHSDRRITESRITSGTNSIDRREQKYTQKEKVENIDAFVEDRNVQNRREREEDRQAQNRIELIEDRQVQNRTERVEDGQVQNRTERVENRYVQNRTERITDLNDKINDRLDTDDYERRVLKDRKIDTKDKGRRVQEKTEKRVEMETVGKKANENSEKIAKRVDERKTVRQSSVKSLTEKYIKSASETSKSERTTYPKAGLILRTSTMKDSISSDSSTHAGLTRTDSEHSLASEDEVVTTTTTEQDGDGVRTTTTTTTRSGHGRMQERSFLDSSTKVTGVQDILTRMKNADIVIEEGDSSADTEARALLNKFLGATVLMAGMQNYVTEKPTGKLVIKQETVQSSAGKVSSSRHSEQLDIEQCWDERVLRKLLDECSDYEQRRRLRARLRTLMAEQEACASAVTAALEAAGEPVEAEEQAAERGESLLLPLLQGLLQGGGQRLLAGLGAASHDVVADVRRSLQRLRLALAPPNDHPQARALLALADRLEDALDAADRLDGCKRKPKRRSRTSRHTVGVTREELEEARRMVDRGQLLPESTKPITPCTSSTESNPSTEEPSTPERKQSIDDQVSYHTPVEARHKSAPMPHNVTYDAPKIHRDACVVERRAPAPRKPEFFRHSIADAALDHTKSAAERWRSDTKNSIAAIANKFDSKVQKEPPPPIRRAPVSRPALVQQKPEEEPKRTSYYRPPPPGYNFAAPQAAADDLSKPLSRFNNNKRSRMKRANTIDIGRPLGGYRFDDDTDEENNVQRAPQVPPFQPQTDNDRKFLAFMQKNEDNIARNPAVKQANWSSRFGNIKNNFENRERQENGRSLSASSAKRFWKNANESSQTSAPRPRKFLADITPEIVKPPWVSQRRDSLRSHAAAPAQPPPPPVHPPILQTPISPVKQIVKPFIAKPIPVNQFSHAPMSAFKPLKKITSPTTAPPNIWSPPSCSIPVSPSTDYPLVINALSPTSHAPSHSTPEVDRTVGFTKYDYNNKVESQTAPPPKTYGYQQPPPPTHVRPQTNYPIKPIPSQNNLAAPELVKKLGETKTLPSPERFPPKVDAQQLQIEFYERQIREKSRSNSVNDGREVPVHKPPPPPNYTIVDYTPQNGTSTFVPLQQTPDIEKAKAHKVDYLPDVVMNESNNYEYIPSPTKRVAPASPSKPKVPPELQNGVHEAGATTEHGRVVTRVMRGPVRGAATITAGVRTRGAADSLRGALDKVAPRRNQVRPAPPPARPGPSPPHAASPPRSPAALRSPALAASRESVFSGDSLGSRGSSPGAALARSGSWHRMGEFGPTAGSPRRVVARTKSMHLLAVPKLFEGGIAREELPEKKRTVEAYFAGQAAPRRPLRAQAQFALGRSRTMPSVSELQFLDESNADDAFEDLVSALA